MDQPIGLKKDRAEIRAEEADLLSGQILVSSRATTYLASKCKRIQILDSAPAMVVTGYCPCCEFCFWHQSFNSYKRQRVTMKFATQLLALTINFLPIALLAWSITRPDALQAFRGLCLMVGNREQNSEDRAYEQISPRGPLLRPPQSAHPISYGLRRTGSAFSQSRTRLWEP